MCHPSMHRGILQSVSANKNRQVAVFDPDSCDLNLWPLDRLKGSFILPFRYGMVINRQ